MSYHKAACRKDPELWFAEDDISKARAKAMCSTCPLQAPCKELGQGNTDGIWGGVEASDLNPISPKQQEIAARRAEVHRLTRQGLTARAIAELLGTSERNVQRDRAAA